MVRKASCWFALGLVVTLMTRVTHADDSPTVTDVITGRPELSQFRLTLERTGLWDKLVNDTGHDENVSGPFTILAPSNDAIADSSLFQTYMAGIQEDPPIWHYHILRATRRHILDQVSYDSTELFDRSLDALDSLEGPIEVSHFFGNIGGAELQITDLRASNGYVHIVNKVIDAPFMEHSFADLTEQPEYGPDWLDRVSLKTIVDFTDAYHVYSLLPESGQTHVGCGIRALNRIGFFYLPQTINGAPDSTIKNGEFLNASWKNRTISDFLEYTVIDQNFYNADIPGGYQDLVMATNNCSHMWVTKSNAGKLCFNDGCVVATPESREYTANNGYGYVVDKCIVCSGISMLANYAAEFTTYGMRDISQFLIASEWNLRNLSLSVGNGQPVTLLACEDSGWSVLSLENTTRLASDSWKPHLLDLLRHHLLQGDFTQEDFIDLYFNVHNEAAYNLTTLAGQNITFDYDTQHEVVTVQGGDLWYPDIKGVDGYVWWFCCPCCECFLD